MDDVWPIDAPHPTTMPYWCYAITSNMSETLARKEALTVYKMRFGEEPEHVVLFRRILWLGPKPKIHHE